MAEPLSVLLLDDASTRRKVLDDCVKFIDDEVKRKSGVSGIAIKGGYKVVCKIKPGIIREAMDCLLDEFVGRFEPLWSAPTAAGGDKDGFHSYLQQNRSKAADELLGVTDDRAKRAKNKTIKGAYDKLRPMAKKHVEEAVPNAGKVLAKHL